MQDRGQSNLCGESALHTSLNKDCHSQIPLPDSSKSNYLVTTDEYKQERPSVESSNALQLAPLPSGMASHERPQMLLELEPSASADQPFPQRIRTYFMTKAKSFHNRIPYVRRLPLPALLIIALLVIINAAAWTICGLILTRHNTLLGTAALAYSLGLRHALDADHISAIDLMTRRLVASGQQPVTVGTFFSLGHSTIVVITSIVVAATAASVSDKFGGFSHVGGVIGTSVSTSFLLLLGLMNAYILYKLLLQLRKVIYLQPEQEQSQAFTFEGGGVLFRILKKMFKLIDRPWKMYPLGVMFGLGFDTSSEVALLGISSIQGAKGTSMWLILIFPVLFTVGMCLVDTIDGALMMSLYVAPLGAGAIEDDKPGPCASQPDGQQQADETVAEVQMPHTSDLRPQIASTLPVTPTTQGGNIRIKSPLTFLYYSSILTALTVVVALIIGTIQLLSLILNVAVSDDEAERSKFWHGVEAAGDNYDIIGAAICGAFVLFGGLSVLCYRPFRRWVDRMRAQARESSEMQLESGRDEETTSC